jgi:hypothetical protein
MASQSGDYGVRVSLVLVESRTGATAHIREKKDEGW